MHKNEEVWRSFTTQREWQEYLRDLLRHNEKALRKAIVLVYNNQTAAERAGNSSGTNGIGFNRWDGAFLGGLARQVQRGTTFTPIDLAKAQRLMPKYWKQLMPAIQNKIGKKMNKDIHFELENELHDKRYLADMLADFRRHTAMLERCLKGKPCGYGICSECILSSGYQIKMEIGGKQNEDC